MSESHLASMVKEINATVLESRDILSDDVYLYDAGSDEIRNITN